MMQYCVDEEGGGLDGMRQGAAHAPGRDPVDGVAAEVVWRGGLAQLVDFAAYLEELGVVFPWGYDVLWHFSVYVVMLCCYAWRDGRSCRRVSVFKRSHIVDHACIFFFFSYPTPSDILCYKGEYDQMMVSQSRKEGIITDFEKRVY